MKQIIYKTMLIKAFLLAFIVTIANCSCCCDDTPNHNFTFIQGPPGKRGPPGDVQFVDGNITEVRENLAQVTEKLNSILDAKQVQTETSCKEILQNNNSSISGLHKLRDSYGEEYSTYCDMHTDGGGWTLVATIHDNNPFDTGRCTVGDRWSSEQGNSHIRPKGENNWANLNVFGRVTKATFDDFKCPGYFDIQARDIMIWHVPNNTPFQNYNESSYLKYRTTNGFLTQYGGNLQSLYANHFPILSKTYRFSHDNGPAVPVVFDKGDGDSLLQHFAPVVLERGVEAGFIEFRPISAHRDAFAMCPGFRLNGLRLPGHVCIGSSGWNEHIHYCGDTTSYYQGNRAYKTGWTADKTLVETTYFIFYR